MRSPGAGLAEGSAELSPEGLPDGSTARSDRSDRAGDDDALAVAEPIVEVGAASVVADVEPEPYPSTLPTLVPLSRWLLRTGPPVSSSMPVTASRPSRKITAVAPASSGSRIRCRGGTGISDATRASPDACPTGAPETRWAGITWVTSVDNTWVACVVGSPGRRTLATTTWRVRSRDRSYAAAATAETTAPTAAPTTVPSAPNADPTTAAVAAAPAPAITSMTVRLDFGAAGGDRRGCGGRSGDVELITSALSRGLPSIGSTHRWSKPNAAGTRACEDVTGTA
jgi:hypothetical protein